MAGLDAFDSRQEVVRRLYWRDPRFRELWDDLRDAEGAMLRFQTAELRNAARAEEFRQLRDELAEEVECYIARRDERDQDNRKSI